MTQTLNTEPQRSDGRPAARLTGRTDPPLWWALIQLVALGFHLPLSVLTGSQSSMASTSSVFLVGSMVSLGAIVLYMVVARLLASRWAALAATSVTVVSFWHWGSSGLGLVGALVLYGLVVAAAVKFSSNHYLKLGSFVASVTLSATMGVLVVADTVGAPPRVTGVQDPVAALSLTDHPDIVLLVLDGYARADVMRDFYDFDNSPFLDDLRTQGFDVAESSVANYSITHLSIPALLNMSYMHPEGSSLGNADLAYLADQVSGSSDLVDLLKEEGYTYLHGEGDHWINRCGREVDRCLPGPPLDITGWALLQRTPLGGLFYGDTGDPTTHLNVTRVSDLRNWSETVRDVDTPTFAFMHIQLPHPPLFLDSSCAVRIDDRLDGRILNDGRIPPERVALRKQAWIEQVECANATISGFVRSLSPETIVVVMSDHGPDSVFQFEPIASDLTEDQVHERYSTLTAVRLPPGCRGSLPDDIDTVNTFRVVLSCLSDDDIPLLEKRAYLAGFGGPIQMVKLIDDNADG